MKEFIFSKYGRPQEVSIPENKEDHLAYNFDKEPSKKTKRLVVTQVEWEAHRKPLERKRENLYQKDKKPKEKKISYLQKQNIKATIKIIIILLIIFGFIAGVVWLYVYFYIWSNFS